MRKLGLALAATTCLTVAVPIATAADLRPVYPAPPAPIVPAWSWTGFYLGVHIGSGWGTKQYDNFIGGIGTFDSSHTVNGFIGGGQFGYNWQTGGTVWGIEVDISGSGVEGSGGCSFIVVQLNCRTSVDAFGTIAGRFGVAFDRALVYIKGGGAWVGNSYTVSNVAGTVSNTVEDTHWGWLLGGGVEYSFTGPWSAKIEYNYMDFGREGYTFPTFPSRWDIEQHLHAVKFGINYRFGTFAPLFGGY